MGGGAPGNDTPVPQHFGCGPRIGCCASVAQGEGHPPLMNGKRETGEFARASRRGFRTTRWSLVARASAGAVRDSDRVRALGELCELYWEPVYFFLRGNGLQPDEAMDVTQGFIAATLEKGTIGGADRERGRFRSFLLGAVRHYFGHERERARAQKRGGGAEHVPLEFDAAAVERRFASEPRDVRTPESLYERRWALGLLERVLSALEAEMTRTGQQELFAALRGVLTAGADALPYADTATRLGMTEGAVKVAAHRLRRRYRELLRREIGETVARSEDVDDEIRYLMTVLARP